MSVLELTFKKRGALYEKSDLHYQQHSFFLFLSFHLLDGICRRIVLFGGDRLGLVVHAGVLGSGDHDNRFHPYLLHFGDRSLDKAMVKRALSFRLSLAIFALWNNQRLGGFVPCTRLD